MIVASMTVELKKLQNKNQVKPHEKSTTPQSFLQKRVFKKFRAW